MQINYTKTLGISLAITFIGLLFYGSYSLENKVNEQGKAANTIKNKTFPLGLISDLQGKSLDTNTISQDKMLIYLSVKCPHCLDLLKGLNASSTIFNKEQVFPVFKVPPHEIDSFATINKLQNVKLYHVPNNHITTEIKSVPTFLILDEHNKIKKVYSGTPRFDSNDSLVSYVNRLLLKNQVVKAMPLESCH